MPDQVYNGDFRFAQVTLPDFPDGWLRVGGDAATAWQWLGTPPGPRPVAIVHPSGPPAGIVQAQEVAISAGEGQRWEARVNLASQPAGVPAYLRVYLYRPDGYLLGRLLFPLVPGDEPAVESRLFATVSGTGAVRLEVGIVGAGTLVVHRVEAYRRYPRRALRLDEKGRVFVRHVETVGQIVKPVRLAGPVLVNVQATVTGDIRDLAPVRDGVRIYGSSAAPLATTTGGVAQVQVAERGFRESVEQVVAGPTRATTAPRDVSAVRLYSFAVLNAGTQAAAVQMEISPDRNNWTGDTPEQEVAPGGLLVLAPRFFLRYARLAYRAPSPTPLRIWFQSQS